MSTLQDPTPQVLLGPDIDPTKSPLDKKLYRQLLLPNGLRVLLIQDTNAMHQLSQDRYSHLHEEDESESESEEEDDDGDEEMEHVHGRHEHEHDEEDDEDDDDEKEEPDGIRKAAAAMVVGCGSFHDPVDVMGLAHFCEHMIFMGSSKYPTENAFDSFISHHGGSDNAYTEYEHTLYHFEVVQEAFTEALDMFAQFFISPLFLQDAVEREVKSIESEFQLSKHEDGSRLETLMCRTSGKTAQEHPAGKFCWGNAYSLIDVPKRNGVDIMVELRKFYSQYYYASNMSLVVMGAYTLDELQKHIFECFSPVPAAPRESSPLQVHQPMPRTWESIANHDNRKDNPMAQFGAPFAPSSLSKLYRVVPVNERHQLSITWQIPSQKANWKSKPTDYIAHLMGHESSGSILSACKYHNWATSCSAGMDSGGMENASSHGLFAMTITLSEDGVKHWADVVRIVFEYIGMLRYYCGTTEGMPSYVYEELVHIHEATYKYRDEVSPEEYVEELADRLAPENCALPPERILDGMDLLFDYDGSVVRQLLEEYMTPSNARYDLLSSTFGRAADYEMASEGIHDEEEKKELEGDTVDENENDLQETLIDMLDNGVTMDDVKSFFDPKKPSEPLVESYFGTRFWVQTISQELHSLWEAAVNAGRPPDSNMLSLPPVNPFVPAKFDLKPRPVDDTHHPLVGCSVKIQVTIGKKREWYPATVNKYNSSKNLLELVYEDHTTRNHSCDMTTSQRTSRHHVEPDMEGTFDDKKTKFKVVHVPSNGHGAVLKFGDESDFHVENGTAFPPVPPPAPSSRLPSLVLDNAGVKMWHVQDYKFHRPTAELRMLIRCGNSNISPLERACADLMASLCRDALVETSYLAAVCELGSELKSDDVGFVIRVHGFDDKLLHLAKVILDIFYSFRNSSGTELPSLIKPGRFDACLEILRRSYANAGMNASKLCTGIRLRCLRTTIWSARAKTEALANITVVQFMSVVRSCLVKVSVEAFYHGNCDKLDAKNSAKMIQDTIFASSSTKGSGILPKKRFPLQAVVKLPLSTSILQHAVIAPSLDPQEPNTAVEIYFQVGKDDVKHRVITDLLCHIIHEPLFDRIRTKEQFGYEVFCAPRWTYGIIGISFKVVTASRSAAEVSQRIDQFLMEFREFLLEMKHDTFAEHLASLASNKLQMYNSLEEECNVLWNEVLDGRYDWEVHRSEALELKGITKSEMLAAYDEWLLPTGTMTGCRQRRRCLVVQVIGASEGPSSEGRPDVAACSASAMIDEQIAAFHAALGNATWE